MDTKSSRIRFGNSENVAPRLGTSKEFKCWTQFVSMLFLPVGADSPTGQLRRPRQHRRPA
jgi:hypothetical protein